MAASVLPSETTGWAAAQQPEEGPGSVLQVGLKGCDGAMPGTLEGGCHLVQAKLSLTELDDLTQYKAVSNHIWA